ncbi:hypothetical protein ABK046_23860 [Streptomyces caeruleatus]
MAGRTPGHGPPSTRIRPTTGTIVQAAQRPTAPPAATATTGG